MIELYGSLILQRYFLHCKLPICKTRHIYSDVCVYVYMCVCVWGGGGGLLYIPVLCQECCLVSISNRLSHRFVHDFHLLTQEGAVHLAE